MRKSLHDSLSRAIMQLINAEQWSSYKDSMNPTRSESNLDSFTETGKTCKKRALLECKRRFFNNKSEKTFAEVNDEFCMNLSDRERDFPVVDKRVF